MHDRYTIIYKKEKYLEKYFNVYIFFLLFFFSLMNFLHNNYTQSNHKIFLTGNFFFFAGLHQFLFYLNNIFIQI